MAAGDTRLKNFWDRFCTALAMSSCTIGMSYGGESPKGFMLLQDHMKRLDDQQTETPTAQPKPKN